MISFRLRSSTFTTEYSSSGLTATNWLLGSVQGVVVHTNRLTSSSLPSSSSSGKRTYTLGSATSR